jgi:hypothetical protein
MEVRYAYKINMDELRQKMYEADVNGGIIQELRVKCRYLIYNLVS